MLGEEPRVEATVGGGAVGCSFDVLLLAPRGVEDSASLFAMVSCAFPMLDPIDVVGETGGARGLRSGSGRVSNGLGAVGGLRDRCCWALLCGASFFGDFSVAAYAAAPAAPPPALAAATAAARALGGKV